MRTHMQVQRHDLNIFYFWFKYDLGQKHYAPQGRPDRGSNPWPPDHDSTFHVTETPALTTRPSVTSSEEKDWAWHWTRHCPLLREYVSIIYLHLHVCAHVCLAQYLPKNMIDTIITYFCAAWKGSFDSCTMLLPVPPTYSSIPLLQDVSPTIFKRHITLLSLLISSCIVSMCFSFSFMMSFYLPPRDTFPNSCFLSDTFSFLFLLCNFS